MTSSDCLAGSELFLESTFTADLSDPCLGVRLQDLVLQDSVGSIQAHYNTATLSNMLIRVGGREEGVNGAR